MYHSVSSLIVELEFMQAWTGLGFQKVEAPRFRDKRHMSALRTGRLYPPEKYFCTHFCQGMSRTQVHIAAGRIKSMKNFSD